MQRWSLFAVLSAIAIAALGCEPPQDAAPPTQESEFNASNELEQMESALRAGNTSRDSAAALVAAELPGSPCKVIKLGGPTSCKDEPTWVNYAAQECEAAGLQLGQYSLGSACAKGHYTAIKFECCPPPPPADVCCKTPKGFFILPADQCPKDAVVPHEYCADEPLECETFVLGGPTSCKDETTWLDYAAEHCAATGRVLTQWGFGDGCGKGNWRLVKFECCPKDPEPPYKVCCKTSTGVQILLNTECPANLILPDEACFAEVCCKTPAGFQTLPAYQCPASQVAPDFMCQPAKEVCCKTSAGFIILPATQCPASQVAPPEMCQPPKEVCCKTTAGFIILPASQCPASQVAPPEMCQPPKEVCCKTKTGYQILPATQCPATQVVPMELCQPQEDVCCKTPFGYQTVPAGKCPSSQIVADAWCAICDDGVAGWCAGFDYLKQCLSWGGVCGPNAIFADTTCDGQLDVCLICPAGTHPVDTNGDGCQDACDCCPAIKCAPGYHAVDTDGDGCFDTCVKDLCDKGVSGWCSGYGYEPGYLNQCLGWGGGCGPNAIFADQDCDGSLDVCLLCPAGTHAVDTNGDGCQDACDCCEPIKCPAGTEPVDADGDGCPDTCKPTLCDDGISGWCSGFGYEPGYLKQCLAWGGGCGPNAIFADKDCDGMLDVCLMCPAGTHAVDTNGDGCQDACDCCKPILCQVGSVPVDTNGDGCPDTCKKKPCQASVSGWCSGYGYEPSYLTQCLALGGSCTSFAIFADADCDGQLDVCKVCPAGTVPVDTNGDGCQDACDCPPIVPWPVDPAVK